MPRPPKSSARDSRTALLRAAAREFAALGYDGAGVDRIARRARVTKAMVYYHFPDKLALYREVLREGFAPLIAAAEAAAAPPGPAIRRFDAYIAAVLAAVERRPHLTSIMLRELAAGGRHLDPRSLQTMGALFRVVHRLVEEGRARGEFHDDIDPVLLHLMIMGAALTYLANEPIRARMRRLRVLGPAVPVPAGTEPLLRHMRVVLRRTLCKDHRHDEV